MLKNAVAIRMKNSRSVIGCAAVCVVAISLCGCDLHEAEIAALKADNEHLREELAQLRGKSGGTKEAGADSGKPDLILAIGELWSQRFEDSEFRSKQRLSGKTMRVTGLVENVTGGSVALYGTGKTSRSVRMSVNLSSAYAAKIQEGLAELQKGITVTVQGKFAYERMGLDESVFVNKDTGKTLSDAEIRVLGMSGPSTPLPVPGQEK